MGGQFSYKKLQEKYDVNQITFDVLKLTDDEHQRFINPVITKNCQLHPKICLPLFEAQEQYISNKLINCPCGAKVNRLCDLRKDIRSIINEQFHQSTVEVYSQIFFNLIKNQKIYNWFKDYLLINTIGVRNSLILLNKQIMQCLIFYYKLLRIIIIIGIR